MAANLSGVLLRLASVIVRPVTIICLDTSVELNRIETVNIGLARERCDIKWPFECMQLDMCSCRRAPAFDKSALTVVRINAIF
jgi:hypothetical protein